MFALKRETWYGVLYTTFVKEVAQILIYKIKIKNALPLNNSCNITELVDCCTYCSEDLVAMPAKILNYPLSSGIVLST